LTKLAKSLLRTINKLQKSLVPSFSNHYTKKLRRKLIIRSIKSSSILQMIGTWWLVFI